MYLAEDLKRYYNVVFHRFEWNEPSYLVVIMYRTARGVRMMPKWLFPIKLLLNIIIVPIYAFFSIFLGISIPRGAQIGPGLRIYHYGTIVINPCASPIINCSAASKSIGRFSIKPLTEVHLID